MVNIAAPIGFQQFGRQDGGSPTGGMVSYTVDPAASGPIGYGDPVALVNGVIDAAAAGTTAPILGIFYGCTYIQRATGRTIWNNQWTASATEAVAGTTITGFVVDDPAQLYVAQANTGVTITTDLIGTPIGFAAPGAPTVFGMSTAVLDTTAGNSFRVVGLLSQFVSPSGVTNGVDDTSPMNFAIVAPNNFVRRSVLAAA